MVLFGGIHILGSMGSLICKPHLYNFGLFPGKSAAIVFNNKIELFVKVKGQGPGVFRLLGFRFLGSERSLETLKWEHLTINKRSSEGWRLPLKTWINNNSSREILKSHVLQCAAKSNRVERHSPVHSWLHKKGCHFSKTQSCANRKKCVLGRTVRGKQETTLFPVLFHYEYIKILLLYFKKNLGFKNVRLLRKNRK